MRAARRERYGPPEVIEIADIDRPTPGPKEILVRVRAASVGRTDHHLFTARPFIMRPMVGFRRPRRAALGTDVAGEVEAVGTGVTGFAAGDRVWAFRDMGLGSHADYCAVRADDRVAKLPHGIGFADAAASIEGPFYAYNFLNKVDLQPGALVMINGATGAIGSALLQLCVDAGARVTAVGDGPHLELLRELGAERTIDYLTDDFTGDGGGPYDFVFDAVGKSSYGACKRLLGPRGVFISSELGPRWENPLRALVSPLSRGRKVKFPMPTDLPGFFATMGQLLTEGRYRPVIDRRYRLEEIRDAYAYVASGQKTGALVVEP